MCRKTRKEIAEVNRLKKNDLKSSSNRRKNSKKELHKFIQKYHPDKRRKQFNHEIKNISLSSEIIDFNLMMDYYHNKAQEIIKIPLNRFENNTNEK